MSLTLKLSKSDYEALNEEQQKLYIAGDGDDEYLLDVTGLEDTGALKRAKDHEKKRRQEVEDKLRKAQEDLEEASNQQHRKAGDIEKLEESWKNKLEKQKAEAEAEIAEVRTALQKQMATTVAQSVASELAGDNAAILLPHVEKRLKGEMVEGSAITRVLDDKGDVSALTVDELKKEISTNERFSAILIGSKGKGSGATGAKSGSGADTKKLSDMSATEEAKFANENPDAYNKMLEAEGATV